MKDERTKELDALLNSSENKDEKDSKKEEPENKDKEKKANESSEKKEEKIEKEKSEIEEDKDSEKEKEEDESSKDDEDENENKEDDDSDEEEKIDEEENQEEEMDGSDSEEEEKVEEDAEDAGGEASKQKDKWHGKSREEVIRLYEELEKKSQPVQPEKKIQQKSVPENDEINESEVDVPEDEELAKMTPRQFAQWMVGTVKNIVGKTYDEKTKLRDSVVQEIRDAQKDHPLLKTSSEYRELVLSLIENASQKGKVLSLKDACAKVDSFAGTMKGDHKISDIEKIRLKKAKAQVERGAGAPTSPGEDKGAEEKRLEQIFGTSRFKGPLGGLGV